MPDDIIVLNITWIPPMRSVYDGNCGIYEPDSKQSHAWLDYDNDILDGRTKFSPPLNDA